MKKIIALLITLTMVFTLFAGCGSSPAGSSAASAASSEASASAESASPGDAGEAEPEPTESAASESADASSSETSAASDVPSEEESEEPAGATLIPEVETVSEPGSISYPLDTSEEITIWNTTPDGPTARLFTSRQEQYCLPYAEEETGVYLRYIESASTSTVEAFNLMIAGGDFADLIPAAANYTGGLTKAYSDDIILDLTDMIAEYAPDMWDVYSQMNDSTWATMLESGMLLAFYSIDDEVYTQNGMMTREDLCAEQGISFDGDLTIDVFTDYLKNMKSAYEIDYPMVPDSSGILTNIYCFDMVTIPNVSGDATDMYVYVEDDTVKTAWQADGYREYIEWFNQCYDDGLFPVDFYTDSINQMSKDAYILSTDVIVWGANADNCNELEARAEEGSTFQVMPIPNVVETAEDAGSWLEPVSQATYGLSITTDCDNPELVCNYMNYWFTEAGSLLFCYGAEGQTYELDAGGNPQWTTLVTDNPGGFNVGQACKLNNMSDIVNGLYDTDRLFSVYPEEGRTAIDVWTIQDAGYEHYYPDGASLTAEETDQITSDVADLCTYASTQIMKFMVGTDELNDDTWNAYLEGLNDYNIEDILAVYQNAYDGYSDGTR